MSRFRFLALLLAAAPAAPVAAQAPVRVTTTAAGAVARRDDPARDAAIAQLEQFLARYPDSPLRPNALFQLGELLVRRADDQFAASQRAAGTDSGARGDVPIRPNYAPAIARYEELVRRYPNFEQIDAAAYTLGTLYAVEQRYADAGRMFELVASRTDSRFRPEALFRLGDARFEMAAKLKGDPRREMFARAAEAYEQATQVAAKNSDIYFLALYKLGWAYYNQATQTNQEAYRKAVETFGQLVAAYDQLTPEQQSRLGLRAEAIEYMAVAFTQVGGAQAANQYFASHGGADYRLPVLRRVAASLRDQGALSQAVDAYRTLIQQYPTDTGALAAQREIIDIYQNRLISPDSAQIARLELVDKFAPNSEWARANPGQVAEASRAREEALRQAGQYVLASAQSSRNPQRFAEAAHLYERYLGEFASSDSAQAVQTYYAEALFGQGRYAEAGAAYSRAAYGFGAGAPRADTGAARGASTGSLAEAAGRNAIVAFDSALARSKTDRAAQDSLFAAVDRFVATFPNDTLAKRALIQKGRRASETQRWDVLEETFRTYAQRYPSDPYTPTAQKLVGDALYKQGKYAEAQQQWELAANVARQSGRRSLADTISTLRAGAAGAFADTLIKQGEYRRAAEEVYLAFADKNPDSPKAPDALRDAIETYMLAAKADSGRGEAEAVRADKQRAVELAQRLASQYPNYRYRVQYQTLAANLLADIGQREQSVAAYQRLIAENPNLPGRADAMIRVAVQLDSLGRKREAAQAYEQFAAAYPRDPRTAGALYNAAVTYREGGDTVAAARTFGNFAARFPRDTLAAAARRERLALLRASGDTAAANAEIARLCAENPSGELRATCASRTGQMYFERGMALFPEYQQLRLVISSRSQLTPKGVQRLSARKQALLKQMTQYFTRAIESGSPEYIAAATYQIGLAQSQYGDFLKNVQLPADLSDAERQQAEAGAAQQAEQFYGAARQTWQSLIAKAEQDKSLGDDPQAAPWIQRARDALQPSAPANPPAGAPPTSGGQPPATQPPATQPPRRGARGG